MQTSAPSERQRTHAYRELVASTTITIVASLAVAAALATGQFVVALGVLTFRVATNWCINQPPQFPDDDATRGARDSLLSFRSTYFGCIVLHAGDLVMLGGVCVFLASISATWLLLVVTSCVVVAVFGSFARTAALTVGVRIPRHLFAERLVRMGGVALGITAALVGPDWLIALSALGFAGYGLAEVATTIRDVSSSSATGITTVVRFGSSRDDSPYDDPTDEVVTTAPRPSSSFRARLRTQSRPPARSGFPFV